MTRLSLHAPRRRRAAVARASTPPARPAKAGGRPLAVTAASARGRTGSGDPRVSMEVELGQLMHEFGGTLPAERITGAVDVALTRLLAQARLTQFVPVLAYRYAREQLRDELSLTRVS